MDKSVIRILLVEDDQHDYEMIAKYLVDDTEQSYSLEWVGDFETGRNKINEEKHDVYLIDYGLGNGNGLELLKIARENDNETPMILLTRSGGDELDSSAMQEGAVDFLNKTQLNKMLLRRSIGFAMERHQVEGKLAIAKSNAECYATAMKISHEQAMLFAKKAEHANRVKSSFLANMSHEIRTPMNSILGFAEMLMDSELDDDQREAVGTMKESAETLLELISDILDISKVESGAVTLESILFNIEDLVFDVNDMILSKLEKHDLDIICEIDPIPFGTIGDPTRLRQILMNLLNNALKFTHSGEIVTVVHLVDSDEESVYLEISVQDSGIGIPENKLETIFDDFSQADVSTTRQYGGTGLGLAICRRLVSLMGGQLRVESKVDVGTRFVFDISLRKGSQQPASGLDSEGKLPHVSVLIVDDNPWVLKTIVGIGQQCGLKCLVAENAQQALIIMNEENPELIMMDVTLTTEQGESLAWVMRQQTLRGQKRKLIGLCATHHQRKQRAQGFDAILMKPVRKQYLQQAVRNVMGLQQRIADQKIVEKRPLLHAPIIRILMAEDNRANQLVGLKMLKQMNYEIDIAANGLEVLSRVRERKYDLILMDIQMPEMDGLIATQEIRKKGIATPIIAMTANAMKGDREACLAVGMDDYMSKPIRRDKIQAILSKYCRSCQLDDHVTPSTPLKIMLIYDDEKELRATHQLFLKKWPAGNYRVTVSGVQACVWLGSFQPDLVIIAMDSPEVDATAMVRFLRDEQRYQHTRILVLCDHKPDFHLNKLRQKNIMEIFERKMEKEKVIAIASRMVSSSLESFKPTLRDDAVFVYANSAELGIAPEDYQEILDAFILATSDKIEMIRDALKENNHEQIQFAAHAIKGSARTVLLDDVATYAENLELQAQTGKTKEAQKELALLNEKFHLVRDALLPIEEVKKIELVMPEKMGSPMEMKSSEDIQELASELERQSRRRSLSGIVDVVEKMIGMAAQQQWPNVMIVAERARTLAKQAKMKELRKLTQYFCAITKGCYAGKTV